MPAALIKFTQGATVGADGEALFGATGTAVNVANVLNTGVASWEIELLSSPIGSAVVPAVLAFSNNGSTPAATFTPDVRGPYRLRLRVWAALNRSGDATDTDIRCFGVKETNGFYRPAPQIYPRALPPVASGEVGAKPDENNFGGQANGWAGDGTDGLLDSLIVAVGLRADWNIANFRIYAVDFVNGLDTNQGYADAAGTTSGDYAAACAAAGLVAKKTFAGLAAIFPRLGNGRLVEIVLANGGVNTSQAYADSIGMFLDGSVGWAASCPIVRTTGTNTNAGAVAFAGTAAEFDCGGLVTVTGLNAAGYNPTGAATTTSVPCVLAGGGAPALPADPAKPAGCRMRYDIATATVALRGICRQVAEVQGTDTIIPQTALPATPAANDVFYLEEAGVVCGAYNLGSGMGPSVQSVGMQIHGIRATGSIRIADARVRMANCFTDGALTSGGLCMLTVAQSLSHPILGTRTVGGGLRCETGSIMNQATGQLSLSGLFCPTGNYNPFFVAQGTWAAGCFARQGVLLQNCTFPVGYDSNTAAQVGSESATGRPRINGTGGLRVIASSCTVGYVDVVGATAVAAIRVINRCVISIKGVITGSAGNGDVGLDLTSSRGSLIIFAATPTVTGALGDVRLAGGQIITWAQAIATGITDSAGNRIIGTAGTPPLGLVGFSGCLVGFPDAAFTYLADTGWTLVANNESPLRRPTSLRLMTRLRINVLANTFTGDAVATLYKNGAATAMTVTIPAATTGKLVDTSHPILFLDGDDYDVRLDRAAADDGAQLDVSGVLEWAA